MLQSHCPYLPEGMLYGSAENTEALSCLASLEKAMAAGKILEAPAVLCDASLSLSVDLGCIRGIIRREDAAFSQGPIKDIAVISRVGKPVAFKILSFERSREGELFALLSRKAAMEECLRSYLLRLRPGDIVPARVTHLEPFGAFVDIGCGVISLLSIDCISVSRISHPGDRISPGSYIRAVIRSVEPDTGKICVTHKELLGTWEENAARFTPGQTVTGLIRSVEDYGVFVELLPNLAGLAEIRPGVRPGQVAAVYIKSILPERMKIKLVIIDAYDPGSQKCTGKGGVSLPKMEYFIPPEQTHIDFWRYSPAVCGKQIATDFSEIGGEACVQA